jgi:hypothetical protein
MAASPVSIFSSIANNLLNQNYARQNQQRQDFEQQRQEAEDQLRNQKADLDFHDYLTRMGGRPVVNGLVNEQSTPSLSAPALGPSGSGPDANGVQMPSSPTPGDNLGPVSLPAITTVRKADPSRTVKWKDATGDTVTYELPTAEEQAMRQLQLGAPAQKAAVDQARAKALAAEQGKGQAYQDDLATRGVPIPADVASTLGYPPGSKVLPEELPDLQTKALSLRQFQQNVHSANLRGLVGQLLNVKTPQAYGVILSRAQRETPWAAAQVPTPDEFASDPTGSHDRLMGIGLNPEQVVQANQRAADLVETTRYHDILAGKPVRTGSGAGNGVQVRFDTRENDKAQAQYGSLQDQAYKEGQRLGNAKAILAEQPTSGFLGIGGGTQQATPDGATFTDPWSGKSLTMNAFQRARLKAALTKSQAQVDRLTQQAQDLAAKYGLVKAAPQAASRAGSTGNGSAPKVATQDQVNRYAAAKGISPAQALTEFKQSGYQVQ